MDPIEPNLGESAKSSIPSSSAAMTLVEHAAVEFAELDAATSPPRRAAVPRSGGSRRDPARNPGVCGSRSYAYFPFTRNSCASTTVVPIIVRTETRNGSQTRSAAIGASQTSRSLFSAMNLVAGRFGMCPEIGT